MNSTILVEPVCFDLIEYTSTLKGSLYRSGQDQRILGAAHSHVLQKFVGRPQRGRLLPQSQREVGAYN